MKFRRFLLLLIAPLLMGVSSRDIKASQTVIPSSPQIGPFEVYQENVMATYTLTSTFTKGTPTYERINYLDIATGNERNTKSAAHTVPARSTLTLTFEVPTQEFLGPSGMRITITVYNSKEQTAYRSYQLIVYPIGHESINPLNYLEEGFTSRGIAFKFPSKAMEETLYFDNYNDYFLTDIYYRLPLEQFDIRTTGSFSETPVGTGEMIIKDGKFYFPNLPTSGKNVRIYLKIVKVGDIYRICLRNSLYINPSTLVMSSTPITGYVVTDNFYFPVNQLSMMQGLDITFNIQNFGNNKTNLSWTSTFYPTSSIIGPCNSSEYCVVGGIN